MNDLSDSQGYQDVENFLLQHDSLWVALLSLSTHETITLGLKAGPGPPLLNAARLNCVGSCYFKGVLYGGPHMLRISVEPLPSTLSGLMSDGSWMLSPEWIRIYSETLEVWCQCVSLRGASDVLP